MYIDLYLQLRWFGHILHQALRPHCHVCRLLSKVCPIHSRHRYSSHLSTRSIFDLLGCSYNMPASYTPNEFTSCDGDLQDPVGTYTLNGASTYFASMLHLRILILRYSRHLVATGIAPRYLYSPLDAQNPCVLQLCDLLLRPALRRQHCIC